MKLSHLHLTIIALCSSIFTSLANANEQLDIALDTVDLGNLEIIGSNNNSDSNNTATLQVEDDYYSYDPLDSGVSVIGNTAISNSSSGGMNTTDLLKVLPFVQMDNSLDAATAQNIQAIRPQDFSISGGNYYENNIMINGVGATSIFSVSNAYSNPEQALTDHWNVDGQTTQTLYVNPHLLGEISVYDSNISAKYGDFLGGVVNFDIRKPTKEFGFNLNSSMQNDNFVKYKKPTKIDPDNPAKYPPNFAKYQNSVAFDLPLTDKLQVLAFYSHSQSIVEYQEAPKIGGRTYKMGDLSQNFLLKSNYQYSNTLEFEAQIIHSPYENKRDLPDQIDDLMISNSSGTQGYLSANGTYNDLDWSNKFAINYSDSSRQSNANRYRWDGGSSMDHLVLDWCNSASNCFAGGVGNLAQTQTDYIWDTNFSYPVYTGTLSFGSEFKYTKAQKARPEDAYYYTGSSIKLGTNYTCDINDPTCTADQAMNKYIYYQTFDADIGVYDHALWSEYLITLASVELRTGVRYSYDNFIGNHNIAPRLTADWEFFDNTYLTFGANRYYSNKMLGYAINEQLPNYAEYRRSFTTNADGSLTPDEWIFYKDINLANKYSDSNLDTPYSNELTAALTIPTDLISENFVGNVRLKTVYRQNRKQFARSDRLRDIDGNAYYEMTNNGKTNYYGYSIEWSEKISDHLISANFTWSDTQNNGLIDYMTDPEDEAEMIYYNGQIMSMADMYKHDARQNFAAPIRISASWSTTWLNDRLSTRTAVYYRGASKYLKDTTQNYTDANGDVYDIYAKEKSSSSISVDLNASYRFLISHDIDGAHHNATIDFKIENLLNTVSSGNTNYQLGRSFWIGFNYAI